MVRVCECVSARTAYCGAMFSEFVITALDASRLFFVESQGEFLHDLTEIGE
jgi:hypothetical protein